MRDNRPDGLDVVAYYTGTDERLDCIWIQNQAAAARQLTPAPMLSINSICMMSLLTTTASDAEYPDVFISLTSTTHVSAADSEI